MAFESNCPACGAQIIFKSGSSVVVVCEYCQSAVARTDRALEDLGKVADVVESDSPLEVGLKGVFRGMAFELTGRAQLAHAAGGWWDEWYAAFSDGRWGWLAEAQGKFYLTYQAPKSVQVPSFEQLEAGRAVSGIPVSVPLMVAEKGEARRLAAEGEIPYRLVPGESYRYADLSGEGGVFGTIDYHESPPAVYIGRETTLAELGLVATTRTRERAARRVVAAQLNCPQCAGPLELRAPDITERVTCPNCGSLLDVNQGRLQFLKALQPGRFKPAIPLGAQLDLADLTPEISWHTNGQHATQPVNLPTPTMSQGEAVKLTVIGFMARSVEFDGVRYFWDEYLLYHAAMGFRWLVQSDHHWNFVEPVPPGDITERGLAAYFRDQKFKIFQDAAARVEHVEGEFYWKVTAGEIVQATDYVKAPQMLSKEVSGSVAGPARGKTAALQAEEVNWSLGTYIPVKKIKQAFGLTDLASPNTVAPNQPFPHRVIYKYWWRLIAITLLAGVVMYVMSLRARVFEQTYRMPISPITAAGTIGYDSAPVIFSEPFELKARENIKITGTANVDNNWLYLAGDLINEETGLVQQFELPLEYYYGTEEGERWSEGDKTKSAYLSALPAGTYTMRLEAQWENWPSGSSPQVTVRLEQGMPRWLNLILALIAISIPPLIVLFYHYNFERKRWAESVFNSHGSGGEDGDDADASDD